MKHLTEHLATEKRTPKLSIRWLMQLVALVILVPVLQGCGNKGELFLESDVPISEELEVLDESVPGKDTDEDDEKTQKKQQ